MAVGADLIAPTYTAPAHTAGTEQPRRSWTDSRRLAVALVAGAPIVILLVLRVSPYFRLNNGDPFIYAGYANDFRGHIVRFGYTYYAVRWGLIFPMRAALAFGPVWGYFLLRYVLYELAVVPLYFALRPWGRRVAIFGVIAFVANPVTAQAILSTYHDSIAVPVLTAVTSLLVIAARQGRRGRLAACGAAGCLAAVAVNANLFVVPLAMIAVLALCAVLLRERRVADAVASCAVFVGGIVAVSLLGVLVYAAEFDDPNIYATSLRAMDDIAGDSTWRSPTVGWLADRWYVYAPVVALALAGIALVHRRRVPWAQRRPFLVAATIAAGTVLWFVVHQFLLEGFSMEHAYYFSYAIGPTILVLAAAAGELTSERPLRLLFVVAPIPLAWLTQTFALPRFWIFVVLIVLAVVAMVAMTRLRAAGAAVLVSVAAMHLAWGAVPRDAAAEDPTVFHYRPHYERTFGDADDTAFEAYVLANELPSIVPVAGALRPRVLFWYANGDPMLDSVQSAYLWQVTTVQRTSGPGMPTLPPDEQARLESNVSGYIVLLGRTEAQVDAGLATLEDKGYWMEFVSKQPLTYDDTTVHTMVVRLVATRLATADTAAVAGDRP